MRQHARAARARRSANMVPANMVSAALRIGEEPSNVQETLEYRENPYEGGIQGGVS